MSESSVGDSESGRFRVVIDDSAAGSQCVRSADSLTGNADYACPERCLLAAGPSDVRGASANQRPASVGSVDCPGCIPEPGATFIVQSGRVIG